MNIGIESGFMARFEFKCLYRITKLNKYKGFQVAPAELEVIYASHAKVKDVACIGSMSMQLHLRSHSVILYQWKVLLLMKIQP